MNRIRIGKIAIYAFFYPILAAGVTFYFIQYVARLKEPPSFELAIISTVIGGFALSSGFLRQASPGLQRKIRGIGSFYLGAAVAFIVVALVMPMLNVAQPGTFTYYIVLPASLVSMGAAMLFFAGATGQLIAELPKILQEFWWKK